MLDELEALIRGHDEASGFLETPAVGGSPRGDAAADRHLPLPSGTQLGRYEIVELIGAGGMGEVYRARDPRLRRDVAIKVLPASMGGDADRIRRFEREARAAGALNHQNIVAVYDVGCVSQPHTAATECVGAPYIVTELLQGSTLRVRQNGNPLPWRKAVEYARQLAHGLAAAHAQGIAHRDLKPENVFIGNDGRVKILDFGLAKLAEADDGHDESHTMPGVVMGTVGYMAPEQVRGEPVDSRADMFAFGAILYEMLTGARAFDGRSSVDTLAAVLHSDPPDLEVLSGRVPPALVQIVRRCLEKDSSHRFQTAGDLAFALELAHHPAVPSGGRVDPPARSPRRWRAAAIVAALTAFAAIATYAARRAAPTATPDFSRVTFRRGTVISARFARDGREILYASAWEGNAPEIFAGAADTADSRSLGFTNAIVASISPRSEMALLLDVTPAGAPGQLAGTLARASIVGGPPRRVLDDVRDAAWGPGGDTLAVLHETRGQTRLEFPIGTTIYDSKGTLSDVRVSPRGAVAVIEHPINGDDGGDIVVVEAAKVRRLTTGWSDLRGLAWGPEGKEVWFTGTRGGSMALYAVDLSGRVRLLLRTTTELRLHDVAPDGRVLLSSENTRTDIIARTHRDAAERTLSWLDWSFVVGVSHDARQLLFFEAGAGGGSKFPIFLRPTDGGAAVHIGDGIALALSPDGNSVLTLSRATPPRLQLLPTGVGQTKDLDTGDLELPNVAGAWLPDGARFVFIANKPGQPPRLWVDSVGGGTPRPVSPEGTRPYLPLTVSPAGTDVVAIDAEWRSTIYPLDGGAPRPLALASKEVPLQWSADGKALFVRRLAEIPVDITRYEIATGARRPWMSIRPSDPAGVGAVDPVLLTRDGQSYFYSASRTLSDLFVVAGIEPGR